jgi:hypothetical protein
VATLVLAAATALVLLSATATTLLLRPESKLDATITLGLVATGTVALVVGSAGIAGALTPGPVLVAAVIAAAVPVVALRSRPPHSAVAHVTPWRPSGRRLARSVRREPFVTALVALSVAAVGWQLLVALVLPPFAYDALTYRLTTIAGWMQQGDIGTVPLTLCCEHYPLTVELVMAWPMVLLGSDALVNTVQVVYVVLGSLAVAGLARSAGCANRTALTAACLFAVTPIVLTQAPVGYVDLMVAALALASLHAFVRFSATSDLRRLVPGAVGAGVLLGTKGIGIIWAAALMATAFVLVVLALRRRDLTRAAAVGGLAVVVTVSLTLGGFWFVRNWVTTGNPVHPFRVEVAGVVLFDGPADVGAIDADAAPTGDPAPLVVVRSWAADLDFWRQGNYDYQQRMGGLGPTWAWLGLPLLVPFTVAIVRRRSPVAMAIAVCGVVLALQPYRWWSRFTIVLAGLGALAIAWAAFRLAPGVLRRGLRLATIALAVAGVVLSVRAVAPASRAAPLPAAEVVRLIGEPDSQRTIGRLFFPEYRFVETMPADATVVVDLHAQAVRFVYPLFGRSLSRRVLSAGSGPVLQDAWVVTGSGRPLDRQLEGSGTHDLASDRRELRVWRPRA